MTTSDPGTQRDSDTGSNERSTPPLDMLESRSDGPAALPWHRRVSRRVLIIAAAVAVVAAGTAGVVAWQGGAEEPGRAQPLCGLSAGSGTPLGRLLPRDGQAGEKREEAEGEGGGRGRRYACTVTVDGRDAVRILMSSTDPDQPAGTGGKTLRARLDQGLTATPDGRSAIGYCTDNHALAVLVTTFPGEAAAEPGEAQASSFRADFGAIARSVLAEQQHEVCG
ncbi:hypothetical protein [Kitasatospora sp. NPDC050543]|uniref:hypothetical protein n=1 Tax=Kitasatospora sp. NPDC050543 TaxID=3364054 RepID=UPI0037A6E2ED